MKIKNNRYVLMVQNPQKIGKFGEWKIVANVPTKEQAEALAVQKG
jgi:hypothetical protein